MKHLSWMMAMVSMFSRNASAACIRGGVVSVLGALGGLLAALACVRGCAWLVVRGCSGGGACVSACAGGLWLWVVRPGAAVGLVEFVSSSLLLFVLLLLLLLLL